VSWSIFGISNFDGQNCRTCLVPASLSGFKLKKTAATYLREQIIGSIFAYNFDEQFCLYDLTAGGLIFFGHSQTFLSNKFITPGSLLEE
jgi:hypothetical protein